VKVRSTASSSSPNSSTSASAASETSPAAKPVRAHILIPLLAACSAIGGIGNYAFLSALPDIAAHYKVTTGTAQLTVTAYMVAFALGVLCSGPLADRYGRRPVLIGGVAIAGIASLLCSFAPTMVWFIAARILQGAAGGFGITVSRACVGDLFDERKLARMYAILTMALVVGTALAPWAGGLIAKYRGWQTGFTWLAIAAAVISVACFIWLRETRPADQAARGFAALWRESRALLARRLFLGYVLQAALIYSFFLVFVTLVPYVMIDTLGMQQDTFGLYYLFLAVGFFAGNLLVSLSGGHHDMTRQINAGLRWQLFGAGLALTIVLFGHTQPLAVFLPMMTFSFGQGLLLPNLIAHGIRLAPNYTGVASSIFGFAQLALSAVAVQIMGYVPLRGWQPALWFCVIGAVLSMVGVWRLEASEDSPTAAKP
jgi:DHA1 family bicyclomycin/chloramphenicol resistance-like MFS transporter